MSNNLGNKQIMAGNIRKYLDKTGFNVKEFANELGLKYSTVLDWVNAKTYPRIDKIEIMANYFGIEKSDLVEFNQISSKTGEDDTFTVITDIYRQLTPARKNNVYDYVVDQLDEQKMAKLDNISDIQKYYDSIKEETEIIKLYGEVSAGVGVYVDDQPIEEIRYPSPAPSHDIALRVTGNSMVPMFKDGEVIFVKKTPVVRHGQIGIFIVNGNGFVKKLYRIGDSVKLISINNDYDDIVLTEHDTVHVVGAVIL